MVDKDRKNKSHPHELKKHFLKQRKVNFNKKVLNCVRYLR